MRVFVAELRALLEKGDGSYLAIVLDGRSRQRLLDWWEDETRRPLLQKTLAHHVTLAFQPSPEAVEAAPIGKRVSLTVTGWAADAKAQAVRVDTSVRSDNPVPHVTLSVAAGILPAYSKELLADVVSIKGPVLHGTVEHVVPKK